MNSKNLTGHASEQNEMENDVEEMIEVADNLSLVREQAERVESVVYYQRRDENGKLFYTNDADPDGSDKRYSLSTIPDRDYHIESEIDEVSEEEEQLFAMPALSEEGNVVKHPTAQQTELNIICDSDRIRHDITGIFTTPRLLFADNMFCAQNSLYQLGISINWSQGVFWGQVMSRLLKESAKRNFKYAIVLDYDSVFTIDDVRELYAIMESNPEISAVVPLQLRRGDGSPLATVLDVDGNEALIVNRKVFELTTVPIATGHFGLSMIRLADLAKLEKPWFVAVPNKDGEWEDGKIDEDIMFWKRMRDAGNKIFLAPNVHIGHMELVVVWADNRLNPVHQPINEYQTKGKPEWTWGKRMIQASPDADPAIAELPRV